MRKCSFWRETWAKAQYRCGMPLFERGGFSAGVAGWPAAQAVSSVLLISGALISCARGSSTRCAYENWTGTCQLAAINQVRLIETIPAIAVVQAVYQPQASGSGPVLSPPTSAHEFKIRAEHEPDLRAHLQKFPTIQCRFQQLQSGAACSEGALVMDIPPFQAPELVQAVADAGAEQAGGCAQLDHGRTAAQGSDAELPAGVPPEIYFPADAADATPKIEQDAKLVADAMLANTDIECLAIIGHVTAGERMIVGSERAATIKNLLVSRGVPAERLQSIAAVVPMTGGAPRAVIEADRKVRVRVLLRKR